jgi:D-alanyl-lipoteichoic acid acyltransferase DltB (MBOAT superfamily)
MIFNSIGFLAFFIVVFFLYWFVAGKNVKYQNILLVLASYFFYCSWDWRFGFLLAFSTLLDFFSALAIAQSVNNKKLWMLVSVTINIALLCFFKYFNFFAGSFADFLGLFGMQAGYTTLKILLPIGISFYTFHGVSYVIDVYNNKIKPTSNIVDYSLFVSFFPLLVAGPIERATHLLPQIQTPRKFDYSQAVNGLKQMLWGFFKKLVIADNCAYFANMIFSHYEAFNGSTLVLGVLFFTFQIYGDFSGYTDIAIGLGRLMGFEFLKNFNYPYFSRDIAEFWRRWHISLSSWFRDYLYIPLGGSRVGKLKKVRNIFIVFIISGLWHGAGYTFIVWGALHALFFLPLLLTKTNRKNLDTVAAGKFLPSLKEFFAMAGTFGLVAFTRIFFRSKDLPHAIGYIKGIFNRTLFSVPNLYFKRQAIAVLIIVAVFMAVEWLGREQDYAIKNIGSTWKRPLRWAMYAFIMFIISMFMETKGTAFIYFKF